MATTRPSLLQFEPSACSQSAMREANGYATFGKRTELSRGRKPPRKSQLGLHARGILGFWAHKRLLPKHLSLPCIPGKLGGIA